jgi:hypothetical protein
MNAKTSRINQQLKESLLFPLIYQYYYNLLLIINKIITIIIIVEDWILG